MDRSQKSEAVAELNNVFNEVGVVDVTRNLGMTVEHPDIAAADRRFGVLRTPEKPFPRPGDFFEPFWTGGAPEPLVGPAI